MSDFPASILDEVTKILGLLAAVSLGLTLFHDWGFLMALGLDYSDVPTSISDHARGALNWLPFASISLGAGVLWHALNRRLEGWQSEEEILKGERHPEKHRWLRRSPVLFAQGMGAVGIVLFALFGERFIEEGFFGAIVLWPALAGWIFGHPRAAQRIPAKVLVLIMLLPVVLMIAWARGWHNGVEAQRQPARAQVTFVGSPKPVPAAIYRYLDRGVLVRIGSGTAEFRQWNAVDKIAVQAERGAIRGVVCRWFGVMCAAGPAQTAFSDK